MRDLEQTLQGDPHLAGLCATARHYAELDGSLARHLPDAVRGRCRLACVRDGTLIYLAESAVWATKLRLSSRALLAAARSLGVDAVKLAVKVSRAAADSPR